MFRTQRTNARRTGMGLWLAAATALVASCATGDIFIEVSSDCGVALPDTSPTTRLEFSPSENSGFLEILLWDSTGTNAAATLGYFNWGWKGGNAWEAQVACPGWFQYKIYQDDGTFLRCAPLRADGTVALIDRGDGRIEEVRVPASEHNVVDLGSGHHVRINGFPNVGLAVTIQNSGGDDKSRVNYSTESGWRWLPTDDTPEVAIENDGRTYCIFLDIATGQPCGLSVRITK